MYIPAVNIDTTLPGMDMIMLSVNLSITNIVIASKGTKKMDTLTSSWFIDDQSTQIYTANIKKKSPKNY
jgi:hypothetical protein